MVTKVRIDFWLDHAGYTRTKKPADRAAAISVLEGELRVKENNLTRARAGDPSFYGVVGSFARPAVVAEDQKDKAVADLERMVSELKATIKALKAGTV